MFIKKDPDKLDAPFCLMLYDKDDTGCCVPSYTESEYNEEIGLFYEQRSLELKRLHKEVMDGRISPVSLFIQYQNMGVPDVAKRVGLRAGKVRRHMTPDGFATVTVGQLQKYAKVFDIAVNDFFEFSFLSEDVSVEASKHLDRLIEQRTFTKKNSHE